MKSANNILRISCDCKDTLNLDDLTEFQGNLKERTEDDIDKEIETIAIQMGTTPRRVRLQIENAGQEDALRNQIVENKVIDMISSAAEFVEVPYELPGSLSTSAINYTAGGEKQEEAEEKTEEAPAEEKAE